MDNNNLQQSTDKQGYQTLGNKVFWLFFLQISPAAFFLLIVSIILFVLSFQPFLASTIFGNLQGYSIGATLVTFIISILIIAGSLTFAWLTYKNYVFLMADDAFKIKRGVFSKTENAIPYRQIQNVDIERNFMFQLMGLSRLIILTAGQDEVTEGTPLGINEAKGVIPAIDQKLAEWLQTELLKRADIQKVTETK
jgi:uncharacterized membrane protein YdbT with pleckstrin-like domain